MDQHVSSSTYAVLFYGFCSMERGAPVDLLSEESRVTAALTRYGLVLREGESWWESSCHGDEDEGCGWEVALDRICTARGLTLGRHGAQSCVYIAAGEPWIATPGDPAEVGELVEPVEPKAERRLRELAADLGIVAPPCWWLAA